MIVLVIGVSGSGKTTVGERLAVRLGWRFVDADDYHSAENRAKLAAAIPLTDDDRGPWLAALAQLIGTAREEGRSLVLACSALKRAYRDTLTNGRRDDVLLVHLTGIEHLIRDRMGGRAHFMPPAALPGQLAILEPPTEDEAPLTLDVARPPDVLVDAIIARLDRAPRARPATPRSS